MLKKILLGLGGAFAVLVVVIASRPAHFVIERSLTMAVPPSAPFALVNDFHQWTKWSPYEKLDPAMKKEYGGAESGVGATYHWQSDGDVGEGKMTLTDAKPDQQIVIRLEFIKPMTATNTATFAFVPDGAGTKVTWRMEGDNNFVGKAFGLFVDIDKMVGGDFEKGLTDLKTAVEGRQAS